MIPALLKNSMLTFSPDATFTLIRSPQASAKENMRIDHMLFEQFKQSQHPFLRTYSWKRGLTYGASQSFSEVAHLCAIQNEEPNHAKRLTGGGILYHGHDISYAFAIPTALVKGLSVKASYEALCRFLLEFYASLGLFAQFACECRDISPSQSPFCQEGFEAYDILINHQKIGGNAQRRSKAGIFMHGSIGISSSAFSPGTSLQDLGVEITMHEAQLRLIEAFRRTFNTTFDTTITTPIQMSQHAS